MRRGTVCLSCALGVATALVLLSSESRAADEPEYPASRLGVRTAPILLLSRPDVRADLNLTPAQTASAERTMADLYVKAMALRGKTGPEVLAARRAIDETQERWLNTELSAEQRTRLVQIDLQWEGPSALVSRPVVSETLGLAAEQVAALRQAVEERNRKRVEHGHQASDERALAQRALMLLTAEQKERWKAMLGRPFVPQLAGGRAQAPR